MVHRAAKMLPESTKLSDAPSIVKVLAPQQTLETEETVPVAAVESSPDHQRRARRPTRVALFLKVISVSTEHLSVVQMGAPNQLELQNCATAT